MRLTLDLFAEPILDEKPIAFYEKLEAQLETANRSITQKLGFDPFVEGEKLREAAERSRALREDLVFPAHDGALQLHPEVMAIPPALDHHMYAFIAQAKYHGHTDPALGIFWVDSAGRSRYDEREGARFANELLCGVRSDRPVMTPERWALAIAKVREIGGKPCS